MFWIIWIIIIIILIYVYYNYILPIFNVGKSADCNTYGYFIDANESNLYYIIKRRDDKGIKNAKRKICRDLWKAYNDRHDKNEQVLLCDYAERIFIMWKNCGDNYTIEIEMALLKANSSKYNTPIIARDLFTKQECEFYGNPDIPDWWKNAVMRIQEMFGIEDIVLAQIIAVIFLTIGAVIIILIIYVIIKAISGIVHRKKKSRR